MGRRRVRQRVEVDRVGDARERRVEVTVARGLAYEGLEDDGHLLLLRAVALRRGIGAGLLRVRRGVHLLDGPRELLEARVEVVGRVG